MFDALMYVKAGRACVLVPIALADTRRGGPVYPTGPPRSLTLSDYPIAPLIAVMPPGAVVW